jgi:hypothetical protein
VSTGGVLSVEGAAVLESVSEDLTNCYFHAEECARQAASQTDPATKQEYVEMEKRWLSLARSYELVDRIALFIASEGARRTARVGNQAVDSEHASAR